MTADPEPQPADVVHATALASLGLSPTRLRRLLIGRTPREAWSGLADGDPLEDPDGMLRAKVTPARLDAAAVALERSAVTVRVLGCPGYPASLQGDFEAPAVVFGLGDLGALCAPFRVAVVGTRSATPTGCAVAAELGCELTAAGVAVVSGLAEGIDAAAHVGALSASTGAAPVGVLGTALDTTTTVLQHSRRDAVAAAGVVISEIPPGKAGARWRFAVRNRIMAALAQAVVVVECHHKGGALHTVRAARRRERAVAAYPGSVRSPASAGTNALLVGGARAVRNADDVLGLLSAAVGLDPRASSPLPHDVLRGRVRAGGRVPTREAARVRRELDDNPVSLDVVVGRTGLPVGEVALALELLADAGLATGEHGLWSLPRG